MGRQARQVATNPALGVSVSDAHRATTATSRAYSRQGVAAILHAAWLWTPAYKRWTPWLCAFTGARVGEILGARKADVGEVDGVHYLAIRPTEGRPLKTLPSARLIPLHPALIAEG